MDTVSIRPTARILPRKEESTFVNDCHSRLNRTQVAGVARPGSLGELCRIIRNAGQSRTPLIPMGGRHAMGGQQFAKGGIVLDTRGLNRVICLNPATGVIEVEAGITWPELLEWLDVTRQGHGDAAGRHGWAIAQKQTGADRLTLGGAVSANIHGRGLSMAPIVDDVASLTVVDTEGNLRSCSRVENQDLFRLVVGGYGLFGVIYSVRLQLVCRQLLERVVRTTDAQSVMGRFQDRIADGYTFGDFQFQIDHRSDSFLNEGIFSCYRPVSDAEDYPGEQKRLSAEDWMNLLYLAHTDKGKGFARYQDHYLKSDGSRHWSDSHQFTVYVDDYHREVDRRMGSSCPGTEMITELYVPRESLPQFLREAAETLRRHVASVIYGTVRLIQREEESFLAWAKRDWACIVLNLCVEHSGKGLAKARTTFRALIDLALQRGGSFYLTYHRFARKGQVEAAYPLMREFLREKQKRDPGGVFVSDWYRHLVRHFG